VGWQRILACPVLLLGKVRATEVAQILDRKGLLPSGPIMDLRSVSHSCISSWWRMTQIPVMCASVGSAYMLHNCHGGLTLDVDVDVDVCGCMRG